MYFASESGDEKSQSDFCRVCRCEGTPTKPLFYPCMCTGSIKYIHQECLVKWLEYSKRHTCELCNHRFKFSPIYASGTPRFLPLNVLLIGLLNSMYKLLANWLHLAIVCFAWLIVVPLTACRIYRCLFTGSISSLLTLPLDILSTKYLLQDCMEGFTIVILSLTAFLGYVSLREQLVQGGAPDWLEHLGRVANENNPETGEAARGNLNAGRPFFRDLLNAFTGGRGRVAAAEGDAAPDVVAQPEPNFAPSYTYAEHEQPTLSASSSTSVAAELIPTSQQSQSVTNSTRLPSLQSQQLQWHNGDQAAADGPELHEPNADDQPENDENEVGEAMDWEHLLGLDGSLSFLEHVLWLIAFNTLFIVIFAFCPYHMGQLAIICLKLQKFISATHMESISASLIGYLIFALALLLLYELFSLFSLPRMCYWTGLGYVYIKVTLVSLFELGIFPVLCGFWIDACTVSLFNSTLPQRISVFHYAPLAFVFIHWAMGMLYIFYMASLLVLGRTVLRPGISQFIYYFNNPDFKPIQDMILQPLPAYLQRLVATFSIWGILIVLMLWVPAEIIKYILPNFLPFRITSSYNSPLDYSMEIILLQVALPSMLYMQTKTSFLKLLKCWCYSVAWLLGLRSYLLGDVPFKQGDYIVTESGEEIPYHPAANQSQTTATNATDFSASFSTVGRQSQALNIEHNSEYIDDDDDDRSTTTQNVDSNSGGSPPSNYGQPAAGVDPQPNEQPDLDPDDEDERDHFVPYIRPDYFTARIAALFVVLAISLMLISLLILIVPVGIGRLALYCISNDASQKHDGIALIGGFAILGIVLRFIWNLPNILLTIWHTLVRCFLLWDQCVRWSRPPLHVLHIWTRLGTTCEITIRRPALPAPTQNCNNLDTIIRTNMLMFVQKSLYFITSWIRLMLIMVIVLGVLPTAFGLLINFVFIVPFHVGPKKTIIIGFWEHWIFGIMHLKVAALLILVGPPWWLRNRIEALQDEIMQRRLQARTSLIFSTTAPLIFGVLLALTTPFLLAYYIGPLLSLDPEFAFRYIYPFLFVLFLACVLIIVQMYQLKRLYKHIKDEKYLIGKQLINFRPLPPASMIPTNQ